MCTQWAGAVRPLRQVSGSLGRYAPIPRRHRDEVIDAVHEKSFAACDAANAGVTEANAMEISGGGLHAGFEVGTLQKHVATKRNVWADGRLHCA